jgi:hypothetical protein
VPELINSAREETHSKAIIATSDLQSCHAEQSPSSVERPSLELDTTSTPLVVIPRLHKSSLKVMSSSVSVDLS